LPLSEAFAFCTTGEIKDGKAPLGLSLAINLLMDKKITLGVSAMTRDLTNMPFPRSASFREKDNELGNLVFGNHNTTLNIESMLLEEFNYASITAYQAMEDRARVSSLYYLLLGALASALLAIYQLGGNTHTYSKPLVIALFVLAGLLSITFYEKIIRLRQAYRESLICMNVIKEFYIEQFQQQMPEVEKAFRWRLKTIPPGERIGSVTFAISSLIGLMGSICFALAVLVGIQPNIISKPAAYGFQTYLIPILVLIFCLLFYTRYYRFTLNKHKEAEVLEQQAEKIRTTLPDTKAK
jgi:predicted membrane channel-forming protein YqfA (hemolysin III family)